MNCINHTAKLEFMQFKIIAVSGFLFSNSLACAMI